MRLQACILALALMVPSVALAYPNGTPHYVTNTGPFCASCHSAAKAEYMPEVPGAFAEREIPENKHYGLVNSPWPPNPYLELTEEQKEAIIEEARYIDSNAGVTIKAPSRVKAGEVIKVTVKAVGGNGPAIGVMLVDRPLRYQARPPSADGWLITGEPEIRGQDGKLQKKWLDKRHQGRRNLNFALVMDQKYDRAKGNFPSAEVTYTLKAPLQPGSYNLTAALLYGTENTNKAGFFQRPSGRILFSGELTVVVE